MPSYARQKSAKKAWGDLQEKANQGFALGYICALLALKNRGCPFTAEEKEDLLLDGIKYATEHDYLESIQHLKRAVDNVKKAAEERKKK